MRAAVPANEKCFCANVAIALVGFKDAKEAAEAIVESEAKRIMKGIKIESVVYSTEVAATATDAEK